MRAKEEETPRAIGNLCKRLSRTYFDVTSDRRSVSGHLDHLDKVCFADNSDWVPFFDQRFRLPVF